jgi:hypothetical protein
LPGRLRRAVVEAGHPRRRGVGGGVASGPAAAGAARTR